MVGVIFFHSPVGVMKRAIRVERESMWDLKWSTCHSRATLGHNIGSTYALFIIFFPDTVLMGPKVQRDEVDGLEVACHGCGRKYCAAATEGSVFEAGWDSL